MSAFQQACVVAVITGLMIFIIAGTSLLLL